MASTGSLLENHLIAEMEEEKATIHINQEFLQNHDIGEANADQPVETLQNKEEYEEDDF